MSGAEIMSGAKSQKWVHQKPTNQNKLNNNWHNHSQALQNILYSVTFGRKSLYLIFFIFAVR